MLDYTRLLNFYKLDTLFRLTHDLSRNGKTIGFTHGSFDLFHVGHLHLLKEARKQCDVLIVAVDSDEKLAKYKDVRKPIIKADRRLEIVNHVTDVSLAFVNDLPFANESYEHLYKELHIDFVAIGRRFGAEDIIEERTSRLGIGLTKITNDLESTSNIIHEIINKYYIMSGNAKRS